MNAKTNAPLVVWHSRHELMPAVRAALSLYRIVHINSYHTTRDVSEVWRDIRMEAHALPNVILTTWDHAPLRALISSTHLSGNRLISGETCRIVKTVMMPDDPAAWSGRFKEHYYNPDRKCICFRPWVPMTAGVE